MKKLKVAQKYGYLLEMNAEGEEGVLRILKAVEGKPLPLVKQTLRFPSRAAMRKYVNDWKNI